MKQTIIKTVGIYRLTSRLELSQSKDAPYQLEIYYTQESPNKNVGVLNNNTQKFSYKVGDTIDITPKVTVNQFCYLTNVVINEFLQTYLKNR